MHTWIFVHQFDHDTCQNKDEWTHATLHAIELMVKVKNKVKIMVKVIGLRLGLGLNI
jgi:hypothetical protein